MWSIQELRTRIASEKNPLVRSYMERKLEKRIERARKGAGMGISFDPGIPLPRDVKVRAAA